MGLATGKISILGFSIERAGDAGSELLKELKALRETDERAFTAIGEVRELAHGALDRVSRLEERVEGS